LRKTGLCAPIRCWNSTIQHSDSTVRSILCLRTGQSLRISGSGYRGDVVDAISAPAGACGDVLVGVRSGAEISSALCSSDVFLFVRGGLSTRRGSGLAALGCGLPVVAYRGEETGFPLTDAGIVFVPEGDVELLGDELARVLLDRELRLQMSERNLAVFRQWFSWDQIASRWIGVLRLNKELSK